MDHPEGTDTTPQDKTPTTRSGLVNAIASAYMEVRAWRELARDWERLYGREIPNGILGWVAATAWAAGYAAQAGSTIAWIFAGVSAFNASFAGARYVHWRRNTPCGKADR